MKDVDAPLLQAMLLLRTYRRVTFAEFAAEAARLSPVSRIEHLTSDRGAAEETGVSALTIDGQRLAILEIDAPAPSIALNFGPAPNLLWPDYQKALARQQAHVIISPMDRAESRAERLAIARLVTLAAAAYSAVNAPIGVVWADAGNLLPAETFKFTTNALSRPGGTPTLFWVRVFLAPAAPGRLIAGTLGLAALGRQEIEYAPIAMEAATLLPHIWATAEYLLSSGATLEQGQTLGVAGQTQFRVSLRSKGAFGVGPVAVLEVL